MLCVVICHWEIWNLLWGNLGACARLRKAAISFVMPVCPSVRPSVHMEQLGPRWTDAK
jgi:hypothetical protein